MGAPMVHAPSTSDDRAPREGPGVGADFAITLKGWRSQLRWAMTQREEDPARVWLEVISIDERSKRALDCARSPEQLGELKTFRRKLAESIATLTEELGDEKVAPLYSWLDLIRQRRRLAAQIEEARAAVSQTRALRSSDAPRAPKSEQSAAEQLARAQGELAQWKQATPPAPPAEVVGAWEARGGDALVAQMPREAMAVGRRGDEARRVLERALRSGREGRERRKPGKHPWPGSRAERIAIPVAGAATFLFGLFALTGSAGALGALATVAFCVLAALVTYSVLARRVERAELAAAVDWVWHARMYQERTHFAELEAGWLRALLDAQRALRTFDAKPGTGGQLRDFEAERPDLAPIVHEVARDTEVLPS